MYTEHILYTIEVYLACICVYLACANYCIGILVCMEYNALVCNNDQHMYTAHILSTI